MSTSRRSLTEDDLVRMRIPERYWTATVSGICAGVRGVDEPLAEILKRYMGKLGEMIARGYGLALYGDNGLGKTGAAAVVAMEARRQGYTVLFLEAAKIRSVVIERTEFDSQQTLWERAMSVDVLILDDIGKGSSDSKGFLQQVLDELIRTRAAHLRLTILTTNMSPSRLLETEEMKKSTVAMLQESALPLHLVGQDLRARNRATLVRTVMEA